MGQSLKAILQLIVLVSVIAALCAWMLTDRPDATVWALRLGLPVLALGVEYALLRNARRKDILPDMLREKFANYLERDGLCFNCMTTVIDGACWMHIYFQNRYEKPCTGRIIIQPPQKFLGFGKSAVPGIDLPVECDGGAFGVYHIPWPIPEKFAGKKVKFQVAAACSYANGRGKLLRFREGMRVGTPSSGAANAALTGGLLLIGVIHVSRPASISFKLPTGVTKHGPYEMQVVRQILWQPDLPTGGFPVIAS